MNTYAYAEQDPVSYLDSDGLNALAKEIGKQILKQIKKHLPKRSPRKSPTKPDKRNGVWNCAVVACCNDNIPGNCPEDPTQWCKQAVWRERFEPPQSVLRKR